MIKVRAHTCYLGHTGYNAHARGFFRELSKHVELRVRNYTWDENPDYLDEVDLGILETITLGTGHHQHQDFSFRSQPHFSKWNFTTPNTPFHPDVDIVLMDMNHHYFYEKFDSKVRIAYTVWESTRLPGYFLDTLIDKFDYVWVVSHWHKRVLSEQGYPESRIHVVCEAVDEEFFPASFDPDFADYSDGRFKFSIFGRWDFRKSVPEMINAFLQEFKPEEPVDLILSVDNPYSVDGMHSTEERLSHYGFLDSRLKVKHFLKRSDYVKYIKNGHVLLTCARSEGWNLPLIEAMAAGTPALYTDYGAQLEFAQGRGVPVETLGVVPCLSGDTYNVQALAGTQVPGYYTQPDYEDFRQKMRFAYENYTELKEKSAEDSELLRDEFTWENAALNAQKFLKDSLPQPKEHTLTLVRNSEQCAIILSHANTKVKEMRLADLVSSLRKEGLTTIVSSHIPVNVDCDFAVIDANNPVVGPEESDSYGRELPIFVWQRGGNRVYTYFDYNHGPAALVLLKNGVDLAVGKGFQTCHVVNYDYYVKNPKALTQRHWQELQKKEMVFYGWKTHDEVSTGLFSARTDSLQKCLLQVQTLGDYFQYGNHLENFFYGLLEKQEVDYKVLGPPPPADFSVDAETVPLYPYVSLGKDNFYYALSKLGDKIVVSLMDFFKHPIEVEITVRGKKCKLTIHTQDVHFYVTEEDLSSGVSLHLPSFEKTVLLDSNTKRGVCEFQDLSQIQSFQELFVANRVAPKRRINITYVDGSRVEILEDAQNRYLVEFIDQGDSGRVVYTSEIGSNCWCAVSREYYTDWRIRITDLETREVVHNESIDLSGQRVFICFESSSLGDTLAWIPYVEEFRKKHNCHVLVSTFHNYLFQGVYPELEFLERGVNAEGIIACYRVGWFYHGNTEEHDGIKAPRGFRDQPMQKSATDLLGLDFTQIRPRVWIPESGPKLEEKYICIGIHATAQSKYWNHPEGWQKLVDYFKEQGYQVVLISKESGSYMGNQPPQGIIDWSGDYPLSDRIYTLKHASMYVGVGSGLSWLAWAVGVPTVLVSGFSTPETEFLGDDVVRVFNPRSCNGCFNRRRLDAGDWNWCPDHKGTSRQFECTKSITAEDVIAELKKKAIIG